MGIKSGNYNATMSDVRPFKYWAQLAAIRRVMRDASDPATVLDALFEPVGGGQSPSKLTKLKAELLELESTDLDVQAAAARYDRMVETLTDPRPKP